MSSAVIVGIGATEFSKESGRSELQLAAEASLAAIRDAGLQPSAIDGMITFIQDTTDPLDLARCLGATELRHAAQTPWGGAMANGTLQLGPEGERRNMLYSPDARVYLTLVGHIDAMVQRASGGGSTASTPARQVAAR